MKRRDLLLGAAGIGLGLTGCAQLPTSGPIGQVTRRAQSGQTGGVAVAAEPPPEGATPQLIVLGFLHAMVAYQQGYPAARQYLTEAARSAWRPDAGVTVYDDGYDPIVSGDGVATLEAPLLGLVAPNGSYSAAERGARMRHTFDLVRENGQWRINTPPSGLLLSRAFFVSSFDRFDAYFLDPTNTTLVPDTRYVAHGRLDPALAVRTVLSGPSAWLGPSVANAVPVGARLDQFPAAEGIVSIGLTGFVSPPSEVRKLLAVQLAATLRQLTGVAGFRLLLDGVPLDVPDQRTDGSVPLSVADRYDPLQLLTTQLFAVSRNRLNRVSEGPDWVLRQVAGDFGTRDWQMSSFAISTDGLEAAAVWGSDLVRCQVDGTGAHRVLTRPGLLRPQFGRTGSLWAMTADGSVMRLDGDRVVPIEAPGLQGRRVIAFRFSPDGLRVAVITSISGRSELGLLRVQPRGDSVFLDGWRAIPVQTSTTGAMEFVDVGWTSPSSLVTLLGNPSSQPDVVETDLQGVQVREAGRAENWSASQLASSPRPNQPRIVVLAGDSRAWLYVQTYRWQNIATPVSSLAYPG